MTIEMDRTLEVVGLMVLCTGCGGVVPVMVSPRGACDGNARIRTGCPCCKTTVEAGFCSTGLPFGRRITQETGEKK